MLKEPFSTKNALQVSSKALNFQNISSVKLPEIKNFHLADYQYEILKKTIADFESELDSEHEVAAKLASFGQSIIISIENIGYSNPSLIHFYGTIEGGTKVELVQHISQINILLMAVKKQEADKPPHRIGYKLQGKDD